jgi:hypothetical protein
MEGLRSSADECFEPRPRPSHSFKAPTEGFKSDDMGLGFDASDSYLFNDYLVLNLDLGHFLQAR